MFMAARSYAEATMAEGLWSSAVALGLIVYLLYALLAPEKF